MNLTYDRPELINKVIFRRRVSTGTWEVCPINEASYENKSNKLSCKKKLSSRRVPANLCTSDHSLYSQNAGQKYDPIYDTSLQMEHNANDRNSTGCAISTRNVDRNDSISSRTRKRLKNDDLFSCLL